MRYSEGPSTQVSIDVQASAARVWHHATDLGLLAEASDELEHAEWIDTDGPFLGARFLGRNHRDEAGTWETTSTVVECDPPSRFAWAVGDDVETPAALRRFELVENDAVTSLSQYVRLGPGPSGLTPMIEDHPEREHDIVAGRLGSLREGMQATVDLIAACAIER